MPKRNIWKYNYKKKIEKLKRIHDEQGVTEQLVDDLLDLFVKTAITQVDDVKSPSFLPIDSKIYRLLIDWIKTKAELSKSKSDSPFTTEQIKGVIDEIESTDSENSTN